MIHVFVQRIEGARVVEQAQRADASLANTGYVLEAPYFEVSDSLISMVTSAPSGWWGRVQRWLTGSGNSKEPAQGRFILPFGPEGKDALGLFDGDVPTVRPHDTPKVGIRSAKGRAVIMHGSDPVLFHDLWVEDEGWRVAQGQDFALVNGDSTVVLVSCGLAPLIVAPPRRMRVAEHVATWTPRLHALHPNPAPDTQGWTVEVREGDEVEVLGVVRPVQSSQRSFRFDSVSAPYRALPSRPNQVLGDEDGTRLVIRVSPP